MFSFHLFPSFLFPSPFLLPNSTSVPFCYSLSQYHTLIFSLSSLFFFFISFHQSPPQSLFLFLFILQFYFHPLYYIFCFFYIFPFLFLSSSLLLIVIPVPPFSSASHYLGSNSILFIILLVFSLFFPFTYDQSSPQSPPLFFPSSSLSVPHTSASVLFFHILFFFLFSFINLSSSVPFFPDPHSVSHTYISVPFYIYFFLSSFLPLISLLLTPFFSSRSSPSISVPFSFLSLSSFFFYNFSFFPFSFL